MSWRRAGRWKRSSGADSILENFVCHGLKTAFTPHGISRKITRAGKFAQNPYIVKIVTSLNQEYLVADFNH